MPLSQQRREQLDSIVVKMDGQGASGDDIRAVVQDFQSKFGSEAQPQGQSAPGGGDQPQEMSAVAKDIAALSGTDPAAKFQRNFAGGRAVNEAVKFLDPRPLINAALDTKGTIKSALDKFKEKVAQSKADEDSGNYGQAVLHGVEGIPLVGGLVEDLEGKARRGDYVEMGGTLAGAYLAPKVIKGAIEEGPNAVRSAAAKVKEVATRPGNGAIAAGAAETAAGAAGAVKALMHGNYEGAAVGGAVAKHGYSTLRKGLTERKTALQRIAELKEAATAEPGTPIQPPVAPPPAPAEPIPIPDTPTPAPEPEIAATPAPEAAVTPPEPYRSSMDDPFKSTDAFRRGVDAMRARRGGASAPAIVPQSPAAPKGTAVEELSRLLQKEMESTVDKPLESTPPTDGMQKVPELVDSASTQRRPIMPKADNAKQSYMFDDPNFFADKAREPKHLRIVDQVQRGAVPVENLPNLQAATDFVRKELKITDAGKLKEWLARNGRAKSPSVEKAKAVSNFLDAQDTVAKADAFAAMRAKPEFEALTDAQIKAAVDSSDLVRAHVPSADTWKLTEVELARRGAMKPAEAAPDTALGEFERRWKARPMPPGRAKGFGFGSKTVKPGAK